jgi:hypothetical protein
MLPDFVIIGTMKCGTTSLYHYLAEHPEIGMSRIKETDYYVAERNYARGRSWYESLFPKGAKVCGEASPNYTKPWLFPGVPERIHAELPAARLIYLVRDPIARMISHYQHRYAGRKERRPLCEALTAKDHNPYLTTSRYYRNVKGFLDFYPREQLLIVTSEELRDSRQATLRRIFAFLEVNSDFVGRSVNMEWHRAERKFTDRWSLLSGLLSHKWISKALFRRHRARLRPPADLTLDDDARRWVIDSLRRDIAELEDLAGRSLDRWYR